jgi:magnesium chelatase subunit H
VRAYFLTLQYWLAGSEQNIANMVRFLVDRYADGPRKRPARQAKPQAPVEYPEVGVYHPRMPGRMSARPSPKLPKRRRHRQARHRRPAADALVPAGRQRRPLRRRDRRAGSRGLRVIPAFATGLDARPAIDSSSSRTAGRPSTRWSR